MSALCSSDGRRSTNRRVANDLLLSQHSPRKSNECHADLTSGRLMLAHYWQAFNQWTVVDATALTRDESYATFSLEDAVRAYELGLLGDAMVGTTPPLELTVAADDSPQTSEPVGKDENRIKFRVGGFVLSYNGREITDPVERRIAWFVLVHGTWTTTVTPEVVDGQVVHVQYTCEPDVDEEGVEMIRRQGFAIVGSLSSMYSALYNGATLTEEGDFRAVRHEPNPGALATMIPKDYWDRDDRVLPLWAFSLVPNDPQDE